MSKHLSEVELIAAIERLKLELRKARLPPVDRSWKEMELRRYAKKLVKIQMEGVC